MNFKSILPAFICFVLISYSCSREKSEKPIGLKTEYSENPLGIDTPLPRFSWLLNDSSIGAKQTAYQILVSSGEDLLAEDKGDVWDSKKIKSSQSVFVDYDGSLLRSNTRYYWKVRIWDGERKVSAWSDPAWFEMGLLKADDWKANWISTREPIDNIPPRSVMLKKDFFLKDKPSKARLFITGLGNYVAYLNGERVGKDLLSPGWTHYPEKIQYQVYPVEEILNKGDNTLGTVLGNMWWSSGLGWNGGVVYSRGPLSLKAQLMVEYPDGTSENILSDTSWVYTFSPILENTIYHGETYDARLEIKDWTKPGTKTTEWKKTQFNDTIKARLVSQQDPPIRIAKELVPINITEPKKGIYVFDLGQNMVGSERIKVKGQAGDILELRFAELLHPDGTVAQENLRSAKATDRYILKGGEEEIWSPFFTYHGYRYVQISGLREKPTQDMFTGLVFYSSAPFRGKFECSDPLLNQIWKNISWGQIGNMMSVPTDCPQRDERLGWMGDAQIFAPTASFHMDMNSFFVKWLRDISDCQDSSGYVTDVNPAIVVTGPAKPGWGDAVVVVPYETYKFFGDLRILEENYNSMKAWVGYMQKKSKDFIYEFGDSDWGGYGDWVAVVRSPTKPTGALYYYYSTKLLSEIAGILGETKDSVYYATMLPKIAEAYQNKYFIKDSGYYIANTQSMNLIPVAFGITPEPLKKDVIGKVVEDVKNRNNHLSTGFLGTAFLLPLLSDYGYHQLAYTVATQKTYPSWGYMVEKDATTMWELWNSDTEKPEGMNSRNHFAYGSVGEWYFQYLAGIRPDIDNPGFRHTFIQPMPTEGLDSVSAEIETAYGKLSSSWKRIGNEWTLSVRIPANTSATIRIPLFDPNQKYFLKDQEILGGEINKKLPEGIEWKTTTDKYSEWEVESGTWVLKTIK